jgi:hypothetical protein
MAGSDHFDEAEFDRAFDATFGYLAFVLNRHLINHMLRASRELGVDYESLVVWGVLAHQNVVHRVPTASPVTARLTERGRIAKDESELRPLLVRDLAQITGLPRETVRRKLVALSGRGFVRRLGRQGWVIVQQSIEPGLREFTRESVRQMLLCAQQVQGALGEATARNQGATPAPAPRKHNDKRSRG